MMPLHRACLFGAPWKAIRLLIDAHPKALQEKDEKGKTPLFLACDEKDDLPEDVIELLIEKYPGALQEKDKCGQTPLHRACCSLASKEVSDPIVNRKTPRRTIRNGL